MIYLLSTSISNHCSEPSPLPFLSLTLAHTNTHAQFHSKFAFRSGTAPKLPKGNLQFFFLRKKAENPKIKDREVLIISSRFQQKEKERMENEIRI